MDFRDTPEGAENRRKVREFLEQHAELEKPDSGRGYRDGNDDPAVLEKARKWQTIKANAGYAGITWPKEYGGQGGSPLEQIIYEQEESQFDVPRGNFFYIGLGWAMPTLFQWSNKEEILKHSDKVLKGDEIWCQLFSEPAGGSDLAALRTKAERDGDEWVINGQKIWTSGGQFSDFGVLVARNDTTQAKHKGLTCFILDMKSPGVEIRPIKQMSGDSHFNEVFFDNVRVPDSCRLGEVGEGWKVAMTTLMNERYNLVELVPPDFEQIFHLVTETNLPDGPAIEDTAIREKLADLYCRAQGMKFTNFRTMSALSQGKDPGPEVSIGKLVNSLRLQESANLGSDLYGESGLLMAEDMPMRALFQRAYLYSPGWRLGGGTDEILRNTIAERVLGLPSDIRADKGIAFRDIPTGARK
ncbi:acyl-CoA dehydrogenase family protein [uncultured Sneathiella sp.]|uniref:acyl-CoA dehydrogenase family protein n=1 Tax=uncultured Sneathiella sp. TaxID=879315 RepID=UPI0030D97FBB|tara:strand:- start:25416 stop:26654 length:1239 start_codon:yes stop_codon:yes gene_type:complete